MYTRRTPGWRGSGATVLGALLGIVLDESPMLAIVADSEGRVTALEGRLPPASGLRRDEVLGRTPAEIVGDDHPLIAVTQRALRGEHVPARVQVGATMWELHTRSGPDGGVLGVAIELSGADEHGDGDVGELESRLDAAHRLEVVGRLAGGVAHDFGNLIATIRGAVEELLAEAPGPPDEDLVAIHEAADRAAELCRELLIFARRERTRAESLDVSAVVRELRPLLRAAATRRIELEMSLGVGLPPVLIDRRRLEQVLLNLVVNARDALAETGGRVTITSELAALEEGYAALHPDVVPGAYLQLSVADSGPGMSPETRTLAFEPFFTTKPRGEGTGLGLSTVYGIVTQAGGAVRLDSAPGAGTTVRLYLPVGDTAPAQAAAAAARPGWSATSTAPAPPRGHGEAILVVDDSAPLRRHAERTLSRHGFAVSVAASAEDVVDQPVDLLLTDVRLPGEDGIALANRVRELHPGVPVLVTSGDPADADLAAALDPPADFIAKPVGAEELLLRVREMLDAGRAGD